uniref:Uncharacterized protein n=1 Tax=Brassica campestris TaxID=3711 RepID=M4D7P1_BRACM
MKLLATALCSVTFGILIGLSFPSLWITKFSDSFTIVLFHYDGRVSEWDDEFEWSKNVIHISVLKQTKWWYAKRFLHPDIVARYDYIFIWDEDLGVDHFNAEELTNRLSYLYLKMKEPAYEKIGIVDSQWIVHQFIPSLGSQGKEENGKSPLEGVRDRCHMEWKMFESRVDNAEKDYFKSLQVQSQSKSTTFQ